MPDLGGWIGQGLDAFHLGRYSEANTSFRRAAEFEPQNPVAHLLVAVVLLQQYIPGSGLRDQDGVGPQVERFLRRALDLDQGSKIALILLGKLALDEGHLELAEGWFLKALAVGPDSADVLCAIGAIGVQRWLQAGERSESLARARAALEKAVVLDPLQHHAMQYLSLMYRTRAAAEDDPVEAKLFLAASHSWRDKATEALAERIQREICGVDGLRAETRDPDKFLTTWSSFVLTAATTPPPEPPPPPPVFLRSGHRYESSGSEGVITFEPRSSNGTRPIRVPAATQARKLLVKVEARIRTEAADDERPIRAVIVIGKNGRVVREIIVDGNVWLTEVAVEALRQWVYEPTYRDGKPVEVVTDVQVELSTAE